MNDSIYCADRTGLAVAGFAISSRVGTTTDTIAVSKAGRPVITAMVVTLTR